MIDIQQMKDELEKLKVLKQAKEELGQEFYEQYCNNLGITVPQVSKSQVETEVKTSIKGISLEEKNKRYTDFFADVDSNLIKLFKDKPGGWHINTQRNNRLEFQIEIEPGDTIDKLSRAAVANIDKRKIGIDSKDGEYVFAHIFNSIFEHLGFETRFEVDDKPYKGMGDNGDFKYGMRRLDIKLRQRIQTTHRWDLWVNEKDANAGYNEFILMRRDGDSKKIGEQRRITVAGYATVDKVKAVAPDIRNKREKTLKYEVEEKSVDDFRDLMSYVIKEVLTVEES